MRRIRFLRDLEYSHLEELADSMVPEHFATGETVFKEGDYGDRCYLVARGSLQAFIHEVNGNERVLNVVDDGDVFGEIAIVERRRRTATVRARQPSLCLSVSREVFEKLLYDAPELRASVAQTISERLARSAAVLAGSSTPTGEC